MFRRAGKNNVKHPCRCDAADHLSDDITDRLFGFEMSGRRRRGKQRRAADGANKRERADEFGFQLPQHLTLLSLVAGLKRVSTSSTNIEVRSRTLQAPNTTLGRSKAMASSS